MFYFLKVKQNSPKDDSSPLPPLSIGNRWDHSDKTMGKKSVFLKSYTCFKKKKMQNFSLKIKERYISISKSFHCFGYISLKRAILEMDSLLHLNCFFFKDQFPSSYLRLPALHHFNSYLFLCVISGQFYSYSSWV